MSIGGAQRAPETAQIRVAPKTNPLEALTTGEASDSVRNSWNRLFTPYRLVNASLGIKDDTCIYTLRRIGRAIPADRKSTDVRTQHTIVEFRPEDEPFREADSTQFQIDTVLNAMSPLFGGSQTEPAVRRIDIDALVNQLEVGSYRGRIMISFKDLGAPVSSDPAYVPELCRLEIKGREFKLYIQSNIPTQREWQAGLQFCKQFHEAVGHLATMSILLG